MARMTKVLCFLIVLFLGLPFGARLKHKSRILDKKNAMPKEDTFNILVIRSDGDGGKSFGTRFSSESTIESLYDTVAKIIESPVNSFILLYAGKVLPNGNDRTFADYKVLYNLQSEMTMFIQVRGLGGSAFSEILPYEHFDFVARILTRGGALGSTCTGTVVKDIVITAAHCLKAMPKAIEVRSSAAPSDLDPRTVMDEKGKLPFFNKIPNMVRRVSVESYATHPEYKTAGGAFDIGIIKLSESVETNTVVYLNEDPTMEETDAGIAGFGSDETGLNNGWPKLVRGSTTKCPIDDQDGLICLSSGEKVKAATCSGDSGAPVFPLLDNAGKFLITGINIAGIGHDGKGVSCKDANIEDKWSITLRITDYKEFLQEWAEAHSAHGNVLAWMPQMMFEALSQ